jgi:hypothetical protein
VVVVVVAFPKHPRGQFKYRHLDLRGKVAATKHIQCCEGMSAFPYHFSPHPACLLTCGNGRCSWGHHCFYITAFAIVWGCSSGQHCVLNLVVLVLFLFFVNLFLF